MLSVAREIVYPKVGRTTIFAVRMVLAVVWIYEGLWRKVLHPRPELTQIYENLGAKLGLAGRSMLASSGVIQIVMALLLVIGCFHRRVAFFQIVIVGVLLWFESEGAGSAFDQLIGRLPLLTCVVFVWAYGPGIYSLQKRPKRRNTWTRG